MKQLAQVDIDNTEGILANFKFTDPSNLVGELTSRLLLFAIVISGLIFFVKLIAAGFGYLTSAGDSGKVQGATKSLTNAAIGLLLVLSAYFIAQLIETLFGINFL